ncbi:MAG: YraN family protein [Epsilonproteobacteria bacterium]|nr:MAG: YraN family protein [Campylobacterota bacterium]
MSRARGDIAEEKAVEYLRKNGFEIIDRNVSSRFGEIDIITLKSEVLHFVEVKSARTYELAMQNITPRKLQRFLRTVDVYLKKHCLEMDYCIDVVSVTPEAIDLIENITL